MPISSRNRMIILGATVVLVVVVSATMLAVGIANASSENLKTFTSYGELVSYLGANSHNSQGGVYTIFGSMLKDLAPAYASQFSQGGTDSSAHSNTNIQVQGVDEADTVKTDGQYLYVASQGTVFIIKVLPANQSEIIAQIPINGTWQLNLYLSSDRLVILGNQWGYMYPLTVDKNADGVATNLIPISFNAQKMFVKVYDVTNKTSPILVRDFSMDGYLSGSRMIGNYLYAVVSQPADVYNQTVLLPTISNDNQTTTVQATDIRYADITTAWYNFITVIAVNISDDSAAVTHETFLASDASTMYVSQSNMYLVTTSYTFYVIPMQQVVSNIMEPTEKTMIYRLSLNADKVTVEAQGSVPGTVLNQYSMDEYNGYFRIATTDYSTNGTVNNLYVLDSNLHLIGNLEGIATGERIYSARFMDDRCYLVTYKQVDPFFVIDLSTPSQPTILGELKVPGFSDYMHPYDQNTIIGIGRENGNVKLSMFDVSNVTSPQEISNYVVGGTWSYSDVSSDPKAFLFDKPNSLLVMPVSSEFAGPDKWIYWQGVCVFNISIQDGFVLRGTITHQKDILSNNGNLNINRALYIGNVLITVSPGLVKMNDLNSLAPLGEVQLPQGVTNYLLG